ncbi:MAG: nucleotidyltransferase domain-containing protein [Thermoanaerobaculia bacterium]
MSVPAPIRNVLSDLEKGLKGLYGDRFRGLLLYGSYARGDEREGSDVDLLLLLEGPVNPAREIMHLQTVKWPLALEANLTLSVMPFSVEEFERAGSIFLRTVRREAIPVAA